MSASVSSVIRCYLQIAVIMNLALLGGCGTVAYGTDRGEVLINSWPQGATCVLTRNGSEIATVASTPERITVSASQRDIIVNCEKEGYIPGQRTLYSIGSDEDVIFPLYGLFPVYPALAIDLATGAFSAYDREVVTVFLTEQLSESDDSDPNATFVDMLLLYPRRDMKYAHSERNGAAMAVSDINASGGVLGRPLRLREYEIATTRISTPTACANNRLVEQLENLKVETRDQIIAFILSTSECAADPDNFFDADVRSAPYVLIEAEALGEFGQGYIDGIRDSEDGMLWASPFSGCASDAASQLFARFTTECSPEALMTYASVQLWSKAAALAGSFDAGAITEIVHEEKIDTVAGTISFVPYMRR